MNTLQRLQRPMFLGLLFTALCACLGIKVSQAASSPTASKVLVVYNANWTGDGDGDGVQDSLQVANYYVAKRGVPAANLLGVNCSTTYFVLVQREKDTDRLG